MSKAVFKVFKFEIIRQIKKPSFWIAILALPILVCGGLIISIVADAPTEAPAIDENTKIAITDEAGILPKDNPYNLYDSKDAGIAAVKDDQVDYYYFIPADFTETKKAESYQISEGLGVFDNSTNILKNILSTYAMEDVAKIDALTLTGDYTVENIKYEENGEISNALGKAIIPIIFLVAFFIFVCVFGNRMLMTVVEEKENRVSEMILTTVSSKHLIIGKIIALLALGMIQILALFIPLIIFMIANNNNEIITTMASVIVFDPANIIISVTLFFFSILLFAGFCTYIGSITPTAKDAAQFIGPLIIGTVLPLYFTQLFLTGEVNGLIEFLTYFPLSAPIALLGRVAVGSISMPELIAGIVELIVLSIVIIRLTVTTFQKNAINFSMALPKFLKR